MRRKKQLLDHTYVGTWELVSWCRGVCLVEGKDDGIADLVDGWVDEAAPAPADGWADAEGVTLQIAADGTFTEYAGAEAVMTWWDEEGTENLLATPFDGTVRDHAGRSFLVPGEEASGYRPTGNRHGAYDVDVTNEIVLEPGGTLLRRTAVDFEQGFTLARLWYRYEKVAAPSRGRPFDPSAVEFPALSAGRRINLPDELTVPLTQRLAAAMAALGAIPEYAPEALVGVFQLVQHADAGNHGRSGFFMPVPAGGRDVNEAADTISPFGEHDGPLDRLLEAVHAVHYLEGTADVRGSRAVGLALAYGATERVLRAQLFTGDHGWAFRMPGRERATELGRALLADAG